MNITSLFDARSADCPQGPAIIDTRGWRFRAFTYEELGEQAKRVARLFHEAGLTRGDRALVLHPMSAQLYVLLLALLRLGVAAVFPDASAGSKQVAQCCTQTVPRAFIGSPRAHLLRLCCPELRRIPLKFSTGMQAPGSTDLRAAAHHQPYSPIASCVAMDPALVTFTSGSTGQPKVLVRTHGFLRAQVKVLQRSLDYRPGEMIFTTLPLFVLAQLAAGSTSLIPDVDPRHPESFDPSRLLAQMESYRPTRILASPAHLESLADHCLARQVSLKWLSQVDTGGAPIFPRLLAKLRSIAPQATIRAVYGSSEAEPIATVDFSTIFPDDLVAMAGGDGLLAGSPVPAIHLRILPDRWGMPLGPYTGQEFAAACLEPGQVGEIVVSGDHVLRGYLNGQGDQETKFAADGAVWHRTGDAGYVDQKGHLWLLGRCSARIEDKWGVLYPFTVECPLSDHPDIHRATVVSVHGRRILAVEPKTGVDLRRLAGLQQSLWRLHLDDLMIIKAIPVDRRHSGKICYPALRKLLEPL